MIKINNELKFRLNYIFDLVSNTGTNNVTQQFIYTVEEIGEIAEVLRCMNGDARKVIHIENLGKEIGDTLITLFLMTKFERIDFFKILESAINKEYIR